MVKVVITAPRGQMDRLIVAAAHARPEIQIVGAVGRPDSPYIGQDAGTVAGLGTCIGVPVCGSIEEVISACDLVIDFSTTALSMEVLAACVAHRKALLCGTTGFDEAQTAAFWEAGTKIPLMKAANTSYVVTVMRKLLGEAARKLGEKCRIEIIDMHSESKLDAPSGTAIELAEEMAMQAPDKNCADIAFHSVRAGDTPSTHRVIFGCMGEKMEISHDAYDWRCYAEGACDAALFLAGQQPGLYTMDDVVEGMA